MKTFFKAESFGKNSDVLKFTTISKGSQEPTATKKKPTKKKKKSKVAAGRIEKTQKKQKKQPIANVKELNSDSEPESMRQTIPQVKKANKKVKKNDESLSKVQTGRVEKKKKLKNKKKTNLKAAIENAEATETKVVSQPNSLAEQLKEKLMGGRFRYINEQLYTMDSESAKKLFVEEPDAFAAYHDGYRHQVAKWPQNPLDRIIKMIRRLPKTHEVGDFGCGEGRLATSLPNKVYSMDLVACRDDIIACDMAQTPLKAQSLDVAVYCLSLMGTNLHDYLLEANRVLKIGGLLLIAEIRSRFESDLRYFVKTLTAAGFELIRRDDNSKIFYFFQFKKTRDVGKVAKLPPISLKPCIYKKR